LNTINENAVALNTIPDNAVALNITTGTDKDDKIDQG
jgi:hypothetical protein